MRSLPDAEPENQGLGESPLPLDVLLLYEDATTALRGKQLLDLLAENGTLQADFRLDLWRFDLLGAAVLRHIDPQESLDSDIVVLAAHGQAPLPPAVQSWLQRWFDRNQGEARALISLLDESARHSIAASDTRFFLEGGANRAGITLFSNFVDAAETEFDTAVAGIRYRAETTSVLLDETLHRSGSYREWGINE
jgi:hypothetical protein